MRIFHTDSNTGELIGEGVAEVSPMEPEILDELGDVIRPAVYLVPAGSVTVAPPAPVAGKRRCWQGGKWVQVPEPEPEPEPVPVPVVLACTPWQIRKALNQTGLRAAVEAAVKASSVEIQDGWEFATFFRRDDALVEAMGAALGKSAADMDGLFALAVTL